MNQNFIQFEVTKKVDYIFDKEINFHTWKIK